MSACLGKYPISSGIGKSEISDADDDEVVFVVRMTVTMLGSSEFTISLRHKLITSVFRVHFLKLFCSMEY